MRSIKKIITLNLIICICISQLNITLPSMVLATESEEVVVQEIDLGDYQSQMTVGEKQLLSVTILPLEATEQKLTYRELLR